MQKPILPRISSNEIYVDKNFYPCKYICLNFKLLDNMSDETTVFCRFLEKDPVVNGAYSPWSSWGTCSKSCLGGVRRRVRTCSNPPPSGGGRECRGLGSSVESQDCNVKSCPGKNVTQTFALQRSNNNNNNNNSNNFLGLQTQSSSSIIILHATVLTHAKVKRTFQFFNGPHDNTIFLYNETN